MTKEIVDPSVQSVFDSYPKETQQKLIQLRQLIFEVASETAGVGTIEETLKWGQISYLTHQPKSGTTIRIDEYHPKSKQVALYVHCQTSLIDTFRKMYADTFQYEGNRALICDELNNEQTDILKHFIELALTYHQHKK